MVQLEFLSGKMAGAETVVRHFPFRIGRSATADLCLEEIGIWDQHLELAFDPQAGFLLTAQPDTLTAINGRRIEQSILRNGDLIEIGAVKIRFWLGKTRQSSLGLREWLTWIAIALITGSQLVLIYWLIR